jgi:hypothetical protein
MSMTSSKGVNTKHISGVIFDLWLRLDAEQKSLGTFTPWIMHSFSENASPVPFHCQILADWNTVVEMADTFRQELHSLQLQSPVPQKGHSVPFGIYLLSILTE